MRDRYPSHYLYLAMELANALDPLKTQIWCTGCNRRVSARLTDGSEMYPTRPDLAEIPFWVCETPDCRAFVGTHHKTKQKYKALGFLATPEVKRWRMMIHAILDPLWKTGRIDRGRAYRYITDRLGRNYHTAEIYSVEEGREVYEIVKALKQEIDPSPFNR